MNHAVIGAGFGDEGKGRVVSYLCSHLNPSLIVRFSGGQQAGHHVIYDNVYHVFSNFGSGTIQGIPTYWSKQCTMDPVGILNELDVLVKKGVNPQLYIDGKCPVTTPYDKFANRAYDENTKNGSCGVGVGATIQRESDFYSLLFEDLFCKTALEFKLEAIRKYYQNFVSVTFKMRNKSKEFIEDCEKLISKSNIIMTYGIPVTNSFYMGRPNNLIIYEGSQGLLLDQNYGFFPNVTRGNTGTQLIDDDVHIHLVTRAYQTRHGNGPMTNLNIPHKIKSNPYEMNEVNYQGEFRISVLDLSLLKYALMKDEKIRTAINRKSITFITLYITCMDLIKESYLLTVDNELLRFDTEKEFVMYIAKYLDITQDIFLSYDADGTFYKVNRKEIIW